MAPLLSCEKCDARFRSLYRGKHPQCKRCRGNGDVQQFLREAAAPPAARKRSRSRRVVTIVPDQAGASTQPTARRQVFPDAKPSTSSTRSPARRRRKAEAKSSERLAEIKTAESCSVCLEEFAGVPKPDREVAGSWGYSDCCSMPFHFECLFKSLEPRVVDSARGPVPLHVACPLCQQPVSRSSSRMLSPGKKADAATEDDPRKRKARA